MLWWLSLKWLSLNCLEQMLDQWGCTSKDEWLTFTMINENIDCKSGFPRAAPTLVVVPAITCTHTDITSLEQMLDQWM